MENGRQIKCEEIRYTCDHCDYEDYSRFTYVYGLDGELVERRYAYMRDGELRETVTTYDNEAGTYSLSETLKDGTTKIYVYLTATDELLLSVLKDAEGNELRRETNEYVYDFNGNSYRSLIFYEDFELDYWWKEETVYDFDKGTYTMTYTNSDGEHNVFGGNIYGDKK